MPFKIPFIPLPGNILASLGMVLAAGAAFAFGTGFAVGSVRKTFEAVDAKAYQRGVQTQSAAHAQELLRVISDRDAARQAQQIEREKSKSLEKERDDALKRYLAASAKLRADPSIRAWLDFVPPDSLRLAPGVSRAGDDSDSNEGTDPAEPSV